MIDLVYPFKRLVQDWPVTSENGAVVHSDLTIKHGDLSVKHFKHMQTIQFRTHKQPKMNRPPACLVEVELDV
jgi:hypothetical protein